MMIRALVTALIMACSTLGAAAETTKGLVTITFDDANRAQFDHGLRLARLHGLVGTLFVPTALVGDTRSPDGWTMTWDEVRAFQAAGWEIGGHGRTHARLPDLAEDALADEIDGAALDITTRIGVAPVSFSSPFGAFTDATIDRIMVPYRAHLSWQGHGGRNPRAAIDPRFIGRLAMINTMTATEVCGEMVDSARNGTWLVLLFHGISEGPPGEYEVSAFMMDEIFACAAFLQAEGMIEVRTVRDALQTVGVTP
jgi:peptidoglycan/xylan/chitin deacetylase (PgdA/CDA1 family)